MTHSRTNLQPAIPRESNEPSVADSIGSPRFAVLAALIPAAAIAIVYAQVRNHGFVWDDGSLSLARVYFVCDYKAILTTAANTFEYLPVRDLTLCVDHALFGESAGGFHLQNVLLFIVASILVGLFYRTLFAAAPDPNLARNSTTYSLLCALVFVLHPLQVEPVSFITARNALLALVFVLATLISYARFLTTSSRLFYVFSLAFNALALFPKATALPVALVLLFLNLYLVREARIARCLLRVSPHLVITAAAAAVHLVIANTHSAMGSAPSLGELVARLPKAAFVPQFYLYKFVWPLNLSTEYVLTSVREQVLQLGISTLLFVLVSGAIVVRGFRARGLAAFLCICFLTTLLPVLNLFPTYPPVADRYAQIPLVFLTPLVLMPAFVWLRTTAITAIALPLIALLACLSYLQVPVWKSNETLFAHAADVDPRAIVSLENLGHTHWHYDQREAAIEAFERLEQQDPDDGNHALFRAWHAVRERDNETAEKYLEIAREAKGVAPYFIHIVKAEIYTQKGKKRSAIREYERARISARKRFQRDARARAYLEKINRRLGQLELSGKGN